MEGNGRDGFNPRAREGRDAAMERDLDRQRVSIHAPARGATFRWLALKFLPAVSIHAPARGATREQIGSSE